MRFLLYAGRWQCSTPLLWFVIYLLGAGLVQTVVANLIGASVFFWLDRLIFGGRP